MGPPGWYGSGTRGRLSVRHASARAAACPGVLRMAGDLLAGAVLLGLACAGKGGPGPVSDNRYTVARQKCGGGASGKKLGRHWGAECGFLPSRGEKLGRKRGL